MKVDTGIMAGALEDIATRARELEDIGYDGLITAETGSDPFLPLVIAAEHTERLELGTGIAVAFARNPMTLANIGYDLQAFSRGRFRLGLGSQIKAHIEKRYSMEWSHPAARMRELVLAMRAIWACWNDGTPLEFRGDAAEFLLRLRDGVIGIGHREVQGNRRTAERLGTEHAELLVLIDHHHDGAVDRDGRVHQAAVLAGHAHHLGRAEGLLVEFDRVGGAVADDVRAKRGHGGGFGHRRST